jgi:hypothetical protein
MAGAPPTALNPDHQPRTANSSSIVSRTSIKVKEFLLVQNAQEVDVIDRPSENMITVQERWHLSPVEINMRA